VNSKIGFETRSVYFQFYLAWSKIVFLTNYNHYGSSTSKNHSIRSRRAAFRGSDHSLKSADCERLLRVSIILRFC